MKKTKFSRKYKKLLVTLKAKRKAAGLTQTQVGAKFGAHASFISKVESGERRLDVIELAEFCKIYKLSLAEFLADAGLDV